MRALRWLLCVLFSVVCGSASLQAQQVVVIPMPTSSDYGWIAINPSGVERGQGATFAAQSGAVAGVGLPPLNTPYISFGLTVPPNFRDGTELTMHLVWNIAETGCSVVFQPFAFSVARTGESHLTGSSTSAGLVVIGGSVLQVPTTIDQPKETRVSIASPEEGRQIEAGDSLIFGFHRQPWRPEDTCDVESMKIHGITVTYQTN